MTFIKGRLSMTKDFSSLPDDFWSHYPLSTTITKSNSSWICYITLAAVWRCHSLPISSLEREPLLDTKIVGDLFICQPQYSHSVSVVAKSFSASKLYKRPQVIWLEICFIVSTWYTTKGQWTGLEPIVFPMSGELYPIKLSLPIYPFYTIRTWLPAGFIGADVLPLNYQGGWVPREPVVPRYSFSGTRGNYQKENEFT